ncbi:MAG: site-specific integrase, partial [Candidatus Heimdallarchaeota archaeon]
MTISMNDYSIEAFMDYLTIEKGCSPNTIKGYSHDLYGLIEFLNRNSDYATPINWSSITLIQLRGYLANLYNDRKNKNSSIHRRVCSIKAFFKFLISNKMIIADPS